MVRVRVPATAANLGPGFDVLGMALDVYNYIEMETADCGVEITVQGEGKGAIALDEGNIVNRAAAAVFKLAGAAPPGLRINLVNNIPVARGMGSSAAALVGGVLAANYLSSAGLSIDEMIDIAAEMEGHPDNVVPAAVGGITLCTQGSTGIIYGKIYPPEELRAVVAVPDFELSTRAAREALPEAVPLKDAVFNIGRVSLFVYALQRGEMDLVAEAMQDRLHQPYRMHLVPGMQDVFHAAKRAGALGAAISGAGPTLIALTTEGRTDAVSTAMRDAFAHNNVRCTVKTVRPDMRGAEIENTGGRG